MLALGVSLSKKANLGVSMIAAPTFIIHEAVAKIWPSVSVGVVEYSVQGLLLIIMCATVRRFNWRYLLSFAVAVIYGYALDMWLLVFGSEPFQTVALRWVMLIVGDVSVAFGVACFFRTYLPLQVHELFVSELADRYNLKINKVKYCFDGVFLLISVVLALSIFRDASTFDWTSIYYNDYHSLGLGTLVTTVINTPIIAACGRILDKIFDFTPMFPKLEKLLQRNKTAKETSSPDEAAENAINNKTADE